MLFVDSPSRTGWEDDDATPLRRSVWDLPTPSDSGRDRGDRSFRSDRSVRSSHGDRSDRSSRGHDRSSNRYCTQLIDKIRTTVTQLCKYFVDVCNLLI